MTTRPVPKRKIKAIVKLKAPHPAHFYQHERTFIEWCMYVTKHLPYIPFEIWAIIFKKVRMSNRQALWLWVEKPKIQQREEERKKAREARRMKRALAMNVTLCPCREYNLSKKTYRAYYSKSKHEQVTDGCPYLYMDKKHQVKQCQWDKLGKEIKSYKLPKFITDTIHGWPWTPQKQLIEDFRVNDITEEEFDSGCKELSITNELRDEGKEQLTSGRYRPELLLKYFDPTRF